MSSRLFRPAGGKYAIAQFLLAAVLWLVCARPIQADIQTVRPRNQPKDAEFREAPPSAVSQSVQVNAGAQVEILLQAHGQEGKILSFTPRTQPAHGKLTVLRSLTRNTAAVIYEQNPGDESGSDTFTFSVQARGSLVSAPATVDIEIIPPASRLVASPGDLDFGAVNVGEISRTRLTLENRGGGVVIGKLQPPTPWEVEGLADYRLAKNQKQSFQLIFRPAAGRFFEDDIRFGRDADQRARLVGTGIETAPPQTAAEMASAAATAESVAPVQYIGPQSSPRKDQSTPQSAANLSPFAMTNASATVGQSPDAGRGNSAPAASDPSLAVVNDAKVTDVRLRWNDTHNIKIAWRTPTPPPKSYRVELRYLSLDSEQELIVDWKPYAKVDFRAGSGETEATLRGLPSGTRQTLRVVAVDYAGRLAAPSGNLQVELPPGFYWGPTPLRVMCLILIVCLGLIWRKRRNEMAFVEEIESLPIPSMREEHRY